MAVAPQAPCKRHVSMLNRIIKDCEAQEIILHQRHNSPYALLCLMGFKHAAQCALSRRQGAVQHVHMFLLRVHARLLGAAQPHIQSPGLHQAQQVV